MAKTEIATFAAGCFWGVELTFSKTPGVVATIVGYTGGQETYENPSYEMVCAGKTGHAEAVKVTFDPKKITYEQLLDVFWKCHDPTQMNRQGPDVGTQYRSAIFYHTEEQHEAALASKERLQQKLGPKKKVMTEITKAEPFYPAEEYHQKYLKKRDRKTCDF